MTDPLTPADRDRLAALLAVYGADPARWPAADRERLGHRVTEAAAGLDEARTIDALLAEAASPEAPPGAVSRLMDRLPPQAPSAMVVPLTPPARALNRPAGRRPSAPAWMALAASLLLGFWAGSAGLVDGVLLDAAPDGDWSAIDLSLHDDGDGA